MQSLVHIVLKIRIKSKSMWVANHNYKSSMHSVYKQSKYID